MQAMLLSATAPTSVLVNMPRARISSTSATTVAGAVETDSAASSTPSVQGAPPSVTAPT